MSVWERFTSSFSAETVDLNAVHPALLVLIIAAGIIAAAVPAAWRRFGYVVTLVHEAGHAVAAATVLRSVSGITVEHDMSGATMSRGRARGLGVIWTTFWGYPAPALVGYLMVVAAASGYQRVALLAAAVVLAVVLLLSRSARTISIVGASLVATGAAWYAAPAAVAAGLAYAVGALLVVGSVRGLAALVAAHLPGPRRAPESSDAYALYRLTYLPSVVWIAAFGALIGYLGLATMRIVALALG